MQLPKSIDQLVRHVPAIRDATASGNVRVLRSLFGPALRGLLLQHGKNEARTPVAVHHAALFDWRYERGDDPMAQLYEAAKVNQWNASADLDWSVDVDPENDETAVLPEEWLPYFGTDRMYRYDARTRLSHRHLMGSWLLSQFLHGEQGALFAAAQVTQAVPWMDAKLYGSTQVVDEGRHVEVFHRYLTQKLGRLYEINDNLYVVIDALMSDGRWDMKFLGMQIMIEGLALGAFSTLRQVTREPLLRKLLAYVIADEARHVHYGVLALEKHLHQLSERERHEREDWAFEVSLLLRNRFLAHEVYDEQFAHEMSRAEWEALIRDSQMMQLFRQTMFKRVIPNLKRIGLLSERIRPRYAELGLLAFEGEKAAPDLVAQDLLEG